MEHVISLYVELPAEQAWALAQLLKRIGWDDCRTLAEDEQQTRLMIDAVQRVQRAMAEASCAPR